MRVFPSLQVCEIRKYFFSSLASQKIGVEGDHNVKRVSAAREREGRLLA